MSFLATAKIALDVAKAAIDRDRPLITHLVITRRCNLSCGYCVEWDKVSQPVPRAVLEQRIDHLARLGSVFVTLTGGESLLHPELPALVRHVRARGMTPFVNTNGFLLTRETIDELNAAGLYAMQLSIDNVRPSAISKKSLRPLLPKLRLLARHARFHVRINTVLGAGPPAEAVEVARTVVGFGFAANCSLVRHASGAMKDADPATRAAYREIRGLARRLPALLDDDYTATLLEHGTMAWKCRAGARTFLVDEHGMVQLCQPRVGSPGTPLASYTIADIRRAFDAPKPCAPTCPIAYAHHASRLDTWRAQRGPAELPSGRRSAALAIVP
ncbi:MAG TPA: radical SAM protein [Kofleriaceae bacterium]|nr:radical SAM protein [Kofleriaceae bacterium]